MENEKKMKVLAVVGPTASGKTGLGVSLAKRFSGEVISADSIQVYREMEIASAKPSKAEMGGVPHYLLDFLEPSATFNVSDYVSLARAKIKEVTAAGHLPIVVGGTGLYLDSLLQNIQFPDIKIPEERQRFWEEKLAQEGGAEALLHLKTFDTQLAEKLHENDSKRIIRGILVYEATGRTLTALKEESRQVPSPYDVCWIGLSAQNREVLYDRINRRVDLMMEAGLFAEVEEAVGKGYSLTAHAAIGHKELFPVLDGTISLAEGVQNLKQETRRYAKRQLTWFRKNKEIHWLYLDALKTKNALFEEAEQLVSHWLLEG